MGHNLYRSHPIQNCNFINKAICALLFLIFSMLSIIFGGAIYMYTSNPGIVGAINNFPWMEASKDATAMYYSIKTYDTRGTLDNATSTVNMIKNTFTNTDQPIKEIKDFIHSAWKDKDIFDKVNELLTRLYKPIKRFEDGQEDMIGLIHNINTQLGNMQNNEIHQLASKIIHVIGAMQLSMSEENMQLFKNAAIVFTDKLNQTDIRMFNKVMLQTDFSIEKINSIFKP